MTDSAHVYPFERDDYPFPGQCVAISNPKSEHKARRCGKRSTVYVADYFPVCAMHRDYLNEETFTSTAAELIHMQSKRIEQLEEEVRRARGSAEEWRRLANTKHGNLVGDFYKPVLAKDSFVYFVQGGDYIKIGKADNPASRFAQLRLGGVIIPEGVRYSQIKMVGIEPGGGERERELHRKFARTRVAGEWFHADEPLVSYIKALPKISSPQWGDLVRVDPVCAGDFSGFAASA